MAGSETNMEGSSFDVHLHVTFLGLPINDQAFEHLKQSMVSEECDTLHSHTATHIP